MLDFSLENVWKMTLVSLVGCCIKKCPSFKSLHNAIWTLVLVSRWCYAIDNSITHTSLDLCYGYQWDPIEKSGELPICLFNGFWWIQKQLWQTYISICSIFRVLQDAVIKMFIWDFFKNPFDIPSKSTHRSKTLHAI